MLLVCGYPNTLFLTTQLAVVSTHSYFAFISTHSFFHSTGGPLNTLLLCGYPNTLFSWFNQLAVLKTRYLTLHIHTRVPKALELAVTDSLYLYSGYAQPAVPSTRFFKHFNTIVLPVFLLNPQNDTWSHTCFILYYRIPSNQSVAILI